jgi:uncharacterized membrane protein YqaE (UPF0057 family)
MLNKILIPLAAIVMLASCSSEYTIAKRKYNKGYYIASSKKHQAKPVQEAGTIVKVAKAEQSMNNNIQTSAPETIDVKVNTSKSQKAETKAILTTFNSLSAKKNIGNTALQTVKSVEFIKNLNKPSFKAIVLPPAKKSSSDADLELILLVILAIFIPPLAVYLKDNGISKWFWVTLILCLFSFSVFYFAFGGTLWLAAVIIALMRVLDLL